MGRGKLKMELIAKEKLRNSTFKKRKEGLIKKLHELTTLCDVSACMIIYTGPNVEIWPQDPTEISRRIDAYKKSKDDNLNIKSFGLSDFFEERKRKVEEELVKQRKKNLEAKYPTWNEFLSFLNEAELRGLGVALKYKAQLVKSRIELLKRSKRQQELDIMMIYNMVDVGPSQFHNVGNYAVNHNQEIRPNANMESMMNYQHAQPQPQPLQSCPMMPEELDEDLVRCIPEIYGFL